MYVSELSTANKVAPSLRELKSGLNHLDPVEVLLWQDSWLGGSGTWGVGPQVDPHESTKAANEAAQWSGSPDQSDQSTPADGAHTATALQVAADPNETVPLHGAY